MYIPLGVFHKFYTPLTGAFGEKQQGNLVILIHK